MSAPTLLIPGSILGVTYTGKPIDYIIDQMTAIKRTPNIPNVLVIKAETGAGKSTIMPVYIYLSDNKPVIVTQPKIVNSVDLASDISTMFPTKMKLGENVSFITGSRSKVARTGITYATIGSFTAQLRDALQPPASIEDISTKYPTIIVDEAHERSIEMDLLLMLLKRTMMTLGKNSPFIIITSATFVPDEYLKYMGVLSSPDKPIYDCQKAIYVQGRAFPIENKFEDHDVNNFIDASVNKTIELLNLELPQYKMDPYKQSITDILIFMPTYDAVTSAETALMKYVKVNMLPVLIIKITRREVIVSGYEYRAMNAPIKDYIVNGLPALIKVIIATNAIETGKTIPTLKYVIDSGLVKSVEFNPYIMCDYATIKPITRNMSDQRRGRVGRVRTGTYYALFTLSSYTKLKTTVYPAFATTDCTNGVLTVLGMGYMPEDLITPPPKDLLNYAYDKLYSLGFVVDGKLTKLGMIASWLTRIPVESIKMILSGYAFNVCVADLVSIACYIKTSGKAIPTFPDISDTFIECINHIWKRVDKINLKKPIASEDAMDIVKDIKISDKDAKPKGLTTNVKETMEDLLIVDVIDLRTDIISVLSKNNLSPYNGSSISYLNSSIDSSKSLMHVRPDKIDHRIVSNLKRCIYEGYKMNIITKNMRFDDENRIHCVKYPIYRNIRGMQVQMPAIYPKYIEKMMSKHGANACELPNFILVQGFTLKQNLRNNSYAISSIGGSVLDGWVGIDPNFFTDIPSKDILPPITEKGYDAYQSILPMGKKQLAAFLYDHSDVEKMREPLGKPTDKKKIEGFSI